MVLLKKNDYITKAEKFISEGPYEEIKYDYTNKFQARVKRLIKEISFINEYRKKCLIESNPSAQKFKCQVKIHKEGLPPVSYTHLDVYKRQINDK